MLLALKYELIILKKLEQFDHMRSMASVAILLHHMYFRYYLSAEKAEGGEVLYDQ